MTSQRVLGVPVVPVRSYPLVVAAAGLAVARPPGVLATGADWVVALASAVLVIGGGRWVLPVAAAQSVLLAVAAPEAEVGRFAVQAFAVFAVLELFMRRPVRVALAGAVLVTAATVLDLALITGGDPVATAFWSAVAVTVAAGLGVYLSSVRLWMARYHDRLLDSERLRESEAVAARATERTAIARELHDLVAHHVASIVLRVGVVRHVALGTDPQVAEVLDDVHTAGNTALRDLRELVTVLRDPTTVRADTPLPLNPAALAGALDAAVQRVRAAGLPVRAEVDPSVAGLDAVRRLAVLRIAQEGLTNALKHAGGATSVLLRVLAGDTGDTGDAVVVEVCDDGAGTADGQDTTARPGRHGLVGLGERVELVGGTLRSGPGESGGWSLRAVLPAPADQGGRR